MRIPVEFWSMLAFFVGVLFLGIVGGLYYAGWNLREVFINNPDRTTIWILTIGELLAICLLWATRPWRSR